MVATCSSVSSWAAAQISAATGRGAHGPSAAARPASGRRTARWQSAVTPDRQPAPFDPDECGVETIDAGPAHAADDEARGHAGCLSEPPAPSRNLIAAVRLVLTYIVVSLYVLIAGPIALAIGVGFKNKTALYVPGHIGVGLALGLAGIRYRVRGREHVPPGRAVVFCSNHESNVDPPVLFQALHKRLHVLFKAELTKLPVLGRGDGRGRVRAGRARPP